MNRRLFFRMFAGVPAVPAIAAAAEPAPMSGVAIMHRARERQRQYDDALRAETRRRIEGDGAGIVNSALRQAGILASGEEPNADLRRDAEFHLRSLQYELAHSEHLRSWAVSPSRLSAMLAARIMPEFYPSRGSERRRPFYQYRHIPPPAVCVEWNGYIGCDSFLIFKRNPYGSDSIIQFAAPTEPEKIGERIAWLQSDEDLMAGIYVQPDMMSQPATSGGGTVCDALVRGLERMLKAQGRDVFYQVRVA